MENNLTYAICNIATDLANIDFSQVGQSSAGTISRRLDDTHFAIKYHAEPTYIASGLDIPEHLLTHSECLE